MVGRGRGSGGKSRPRARSGTPGDQTGGHRPSQPSRSAQAAPAAAGSSGAPGGRPGGHAGRGSTSVRGRQGSVKDMIDRLDGRSAVSDRHASPSKRQRSESGRRSSSSATFPSPERPLTEQSLAAMMSTMVDRIREDMAGQFTALREEIGRMNDRIHELERHVDQRDGYIQELEDRLQSREERVVGLEDEVDLLSKELRKADLFFSGTAIPKPPAQAWEEDVTATTLAMLERCMPEVPVTRADIAECFRVSRGKRILCRFRESGRGSVRDQLYEGRFRSRRSGPGFVAALRGDAAAGGAVPGGDPAAAPAAADGGAVPGDRDAGRVGEDQRRADTERSTTSQLYISENLTRRRQEIFQALLNEKRHNRLYTVFTKNGDVFCKVVQHGRKIRVESLDAIPEALRG